MKTVAVVKFNTVGDLLDELSAIAKDPELSSVLDSDVEGTSGELGIFTAFKITRRKLSDKSEVLDFELFEVSGDKK